MRRELPMWAMGLANTPYGFFVGFILTAVPILLRAQGVSVEAIAGIITLGISPMFWAFLASPVIDVAFSRKAYAVFFAVLATVCMIFAVQALHDLHVLTVLLVAGFAAVVLSGAGCAADIFSGRDQTEAHRT